jgi:hypothetical protein
MGHRAVHWAEVIELPIPLASSLLHRSPQKKHTPQKNMHHHSFKNLLVAK